jgi:hypothetical protein
MAETLESRLVRSGLVSRTQLAEALSRASVGEEHLVEALVALGVAESSLVVFLLGDARTRLADAKDLAGADAALAIPAPMAWSLLALPLAREGSHVVVAMADPTDTHAIAELKETIGADIAPRIARLSALSEALTKHVGPRVLRPKVSKPITPDSQTRPSTHAARASLYARYEAPITPPPSPRPAATTRRADSWSDLDSNRPEPVVELDPVVAERRSSSDVPRRREPRGRNAPTLPDAGPVLAGMRAARTRDELVRLACEGAVAVSHMAIFLAVQREVLRGVHGLGGALSDAAVQGLVLPAGTPSVFRTVLRDGTPHQGALGFGAVDHLFRAATGSRGGNVAIHGVFVSSRCVGLLCADDVEHKEAGAARVGVIAHALGHGLMRLIDARRR